VPRDYKFDDDIFVRPKPPPSADTLSWDYIRADDGEELFVDPNRVPLKDGGASVSNWLNDRRWADLVTVGKSQLFQTPVKHFFVKAFLEEGADEFLAHITTIEAALGRKSDYRRGGGGSERVSARVSTLLGEPIQGKVYRELFNQRSTLLHGRRMDAISGDNRVMARQLARKVVNALVKRALDPACPQSREEYLKGLSS
jgi:hypothetical protein